MSISFIETETNRHKKHQIVCIVRIQHSLTDIHVFTICKGLNHQQSIELVWININKLIIDTRTKFCIYARRVFCLQKTHQWRSNPKKLKRPNKVWSWRAFPQNMKMKNKKFNLRNYQGLDSNRNSSELLSF